jgi:hypothetical protein
MSTQEEAKVGAEVVVAAQEEEGLQVAQVVQGRGRFWEWPIGTKFCNNACNKNPSNIHYIFYENSVEYENGNIEHLFIGYHYTDNVNLPLRLDPVGWSGDVPLMKSKTYQRIEPDKVKRPVTADGFEIKVDGVYRYDFPGRNCNEKCVMVKVLNYARQSAVCVQNVDVSDRMMVVHANQLRKEKYVYR